MNDSIIWRSLQKVEEIGEIQKKSLEMPVTIFKHSTRCSVSSTALARLERQWKRNQMVETANYFLDLLVFSEVSKAVVEHFDVPHQSPQFIVILNKKVVHVSSHLEINLGAIEVLLK